MSAATSHAMLYDALAGGEAVLQSPASGAVLDLGQKNWAIVDVANSFVMPDVPRAGFVVTLVASASATITSKLGVTIATLAIGDVVLVMSTSATTWKVVGGGGEASDITLLDAGGYTSATNVENALIGLFRDTVPFSVPMASFVDADGDPLAKWADNASPNPGFNLANSEAFGIRWNNNGTQNQPVLCNVLLPVGVNQSAFTMHILASKIGATVGDATTFTVTAFTNSTGALHDANVDIGGVSSAMTGDATSKTVQHETVAIAATESGAAPEAMTFTITPTSGTLGTDDVIIHAIYFTYGL